MKKKFLALGIATALLGLVVGAVSLASASPDITSAQTIKLTGNITQFTPLDLGATGQSQGDEFIFSGTLKNEDATQVGTFGGYVVAVTTGTSGQGEGLVTFSLSGGQITFQNLQPLVPPPAVSPPFESAVTGGTGIYQNVRGEARVKETSPSTFTVVLHLLP